MVRQTPEFIAYLQELFQDFGNVSTRRMFGGYGVFFDGLMIGLVADELLYLKVDRQSVERFEKRGLAQFQYPKGGKLVGLSYYLAPEEAMDDPSEMREWAVIAYESALRSKGGSR